MHGIPYESQAYWMRHFPLCGTILFASALVCSGGGMPEDPYIAAREGMVKDQIEARGITNRLVLRSMRAVKRHLFVPEEYRDQSYNDYPLPIGEGQTISQPYIVALMTEALDPGSEMRILEIGTGSGYQAAILAEICARVYTIEIIGKLGRRARDSLAYAGITNVVTRIGDGYLGWPEQAPFDAIIVTCAPTRIPQPLVDQLGEGGRMVIPCGGQDIQSLLILVKKDGVIRQQSIIPVRFVPMVNGKGRQY